MGKYDTVKDFTIDVHKHLESDGYGSTIIVRAKEGGRGFGDYDIALLDSDSLNRFLDQKGHLWTKAIVSLLLGKLTYRDDLP